LAIIDISATREKSRPNIQMIAEIAGEAFMPLSYGGGITSVDEVKQILYSGIEKIIINKAAIVNPSLITKIAERFGSQSIVVSIDVKKNLFGKYKVYTDNGGHEAHQDPVAFAKECAKLGAGEILLNSINRDGTYKGYDLEILDEISGSVEIPVIACGGASNVADLRKAVAEGHASAVAAGSMFVFQRPHNAVLISYPSQRELKEDLYEKLA
jgi:cyclase